jgi:hypothetical protein
MSSRGSRVRALLTAIAVVAAVVAATVAISGWPGGDDERAVVSPGPGVRLGLIANSLDMGTQQGATQTRVRETGVRWIREELRWDVVEPARGRFDWTSFDELMANAGRRGLHVLPLLIGAPAWTSPADDELPADVPAFGDFTAAVVRRYGPGGSFWRARPRLDDALAPRWYELFNEPFLARGDAPVDPARYARLAYAGAVAGHAADPSARFLLAVDTTYEGEDGAAPDWLDALVKAQPRILDVVDGAAVHPYGTIAETPEPNPRWSFERIDRIRRTLVAHGAGRLPFWVTELGWSSCAGDSACLSEDGQANALATAFRLIAQRRDVEALFVYRLDDIRAAGREGSYGILRRDYSRKPAWSVVRAAALAR